MSTITEVQTSDDDQIAPASTALVLHQNSTTITLITYDISSSQDLSNKVNWDIQISVFDTVLNPDLLADALNIPVQKVLSITADTEEAQHYAMELMEYIRKRI